MIDSQTVAEVQTPTRTSTSADWVTAVVLSTAISIAAVLIGEHSFHLGTAVIVLVPIIWAVLIGGLIGVQRIRPITPGTRGVATLLIEVGIILFLARLGTGIGPSLADMGEIGPAIMLQELGHIFGTVILALPVAVGIGLGRAAVGACWSIDRESFLAYAIERFGLRSPEYRGVFSVWLLGTLFGAAFISLIAGILGGMDIFDPRALALGLGLGSGSMMLGGVGALSVIYPQHKAEIIALAALSNLVTNIVGFYAGVFISLPMCRRLYTFWARVFGKADNGTDATAARGTTTGEAITSVEKDPAPAMTWRVGVLVYAITAVCDLTINWVGTKALHWDDLTGIAILLALTYISITVSQKFPMLPSSVVVLALATIVSAPFFPVAHLVVTSMSGLDVIMTGLAVIALIGLTLGRDVAALKSLSWKVVIVALITYTASFVAAATISQFTLHL
ncbi:DUF3100 domain-containing protein [Leekyejoonella antrihumi]|uniref:DUF3100 domain-containing protein n=1 Tax=Leekyejoonella antrihumi TaxID=1660198 RepID=A0A563DY70_9MICO|nr:DUF3100 domain-containing protein [Leekyejoonella antrihumi]TWP35166.1 DUF3100 domain-containing protein [Leekyejoonella antrihumi]